MNGMGRIGIACLALLAMGCVRRSLTVTSSPSGALVYLNGQEVGRTPLTRDFTWYGTYDVQVRKEGYETLDTQTRIIAPIWQWPPFDLFAELVPFGLKDHQYRTYELKPAATEPADPAQMLARAEQLRGELRSSKYTRVPATRPATQESQ